MNEASKNSFETDSGGGLSWLLKRGMPLVMLAAIAGMAVGCGRWATGFIPGVQGMLVGGVLAWLVGRWAAGPLRRTPTPTGVRGSDSGCG